MVGIHINYLTSLDKGREKESGIAATQQRRVVCLFLLPSSLPVEVVPVLREVGAGKEGPVLTIEPAGASVRLVRRLHQLGIPVEPTLGDGPFA